MIPNDSATLQTLQKLKCSSILDFALLIPKTYQNLAPITSLTPLPQTGVARVQITHAQRYKKLTIFHATMLDFNTSLQIQVFHPKPYHYAVFAEGKELLIYGQFHWEFQLNIKQPKIITEYGKITPVFPNKTLKNATINNLASQLLTYENLARYGIPEHIINDFLPIFFPTPAFFTQFQQNNALPPRNFKALKFIEVFNYLQKLHQKKLYFPAKFQCNGDYSAFVDSLPFQLTHGQTQAISTIAQDLRSSKASKRLIMGDVGCGKTIVILASVIIAQPHKAILMAPTTILAQQLYNEAQKYLPKSIRIGLFVGDLTSKKQEFQDFDFIIGTQALLYRQENLKDYALIITDEQHRFGTLQRHKLEKLATTEGKKPHILQFSATPIPRTMALLNSDLIDYTFIKDIPFPKDIDTQIITKTDFPALLKHIQHQHALNHQTIIVYPLIEESESIPYLPLQQARIFWEKHFSNVYTTNGKDKNKDEILIEFAEKGSILLSTTMIEVGISLPKLSSIVIVGAERMGLATLHQLRGRVSRNGLKGYCFLYTNHPQTQRLQDFCKTLNGFEIAELDLHYRKSGDLLCGERQSGDEFKYFNLQDDVEILQDVKKLTLKLQTPNSKKQNKF
ncbi:ATP-dependent DNA helicase RecG [Helicobacter enhydrae]|uniref:ATP-dependent DNA helicase RecG n=1 Tax=Helicobacter enhydrae TaxID=222136 RepID=A0A1B1U7K0_9HELI|nr:ATP-dependent DNA helicase RecG [Helicobacter enhydrae]ANV98726.1 ATP-dependent DNA helicase RecG [Helicobacter enhydrae]